MLKRLFLLCCLIWLAAPQWATAQILRPVKWTFAAEQNGGDATITFTATIDRGWHLYSQNIPDEGPIPTSFNFEKTGAVEFIGKTTEGKGEESYDPNFDMKLVFFSNKAEFKQKLKIRSEKDFVVKGFLEFMVCDDKQCLPPDEVAFSFSLKGFKNPPGSSLPLPDTTTSAVIENPEDNSAGKVITHDTVVVEADSTGEGGVSIVAENPSRSLWGIFIAGFFGGLLALLTPCVFPMLPLTVSFFTKKSGSSSKALGNALIYGISIIFIYVALGYGITRALGPDALNVLASSAFFNLLFFILFVVFAASFFGAFEITLPSSWVNTVDKQSERRGLVGIFFMAFTLALVSFSCTGPIIGTLLVEAATGRSQLGPVTGMLGFSLALAIPFAVFAAFPTWLNSLPKSGGWLNSVKVVLGFLELALAMKFLSNVDLAYHWGILDREVFLVSWIIIFGMLGFYLLGKLKFHHDSDVDYISIPRLFLSIISLAFALYMIPGLWGAPLKAISAFSPPQATQDFDLYTSMNARTAAIHPKGETGTKYAGTFHCPHNLPCFFDYDEGMSYATKAGKPVLLDFTGWSCVNCRKMEVSVWSDPEVLKMLRDEFVLISLYVDDRTELPENEKYVSTYIPGKKIKTLGNKWSDFQTGRFNTNSQPYYVLLDHDGELLVPPHAFDLNVQTYVDFLTRGLEVYKQRVQ